MEYLFWGKVVTGKKRGKNLGFPTANVSLHKKIPEGIYVSVTKINQTWHESLTFIGDAKTFDEQDIKAETYVLSFHRNLYNQWITIKLLKKLRGNKKFDSAAELVSQMKLDLKNAEEYFMIHKDV